MNEWMNEWMMHLNFALLCIVVHPKHFTIMCGVSPQPPPVCSIHLGDVTAATGQRRQRRFVCSLWVTSNLLRMILLNSEASPTFLSDL